MSDADNDRKRKAVEMDAAAVAPKKKLAAQAALAAAEAAGRESAGAAKAGGVVKLESTKAPSYSVEETAPSGANAADSEEVLKFQNERIYAALEAKKHEVARLEHALSKHEATDKLQRETLGCISRHWCALTEELKGTLQRLEHAPRAMDTSQPAKLLESLSSLKGLVPKDVDPAMVKSCQVAQDLLLEIVQSVTDHDVQLKAVLAKLEASTDDETVKAEVAKVNKRLDAMAKDFDRMQDVHREYVVEEGAKTDALRVKAAQVTGLQEKVEYMTGQVEQAERRLVLSEQAVRAARDAGPATDAATSGGSSAESGSDSAQHRNLEYKHQAESRLEEIKTLQKKIIQLTEQNGAASYAPQEVSESMITQSQTYLALSEHSKAIEKESKHHVGKITLLNLELAQEREKQQRERRELEMQHQQKIKQVILEKQLKSNELMEAKQEIKSLQFKLEQKSVGEISTKRAQELEETLQKAQAECSRLRKEHDALKAKPDAEELRREFREEKEKLQKERDTELNKATDLAEQLKERDKKMEALLACSKGDGANGVHGPDSAHRKEVEGLKAEVTGLRTDKRELTRRFQKAERGFNECNKLYQQHKKDKEETMKDLESLGLSFEEMQEQNTRLLQTMKQKDEDHNELLRQRIKERQEREMLADEKNALKLKLDKLEELAKAREDAIEKCKLDLESLQQEQLKKAKEEECSAAIVAEHRKMLLIRESQAKEARREADKARNSMADLQKAKQDAERELHEARFERTRIDEKLESTQRRLAQLERQGGGGGGGGGGTLDASRENLLKHYRSCVKCHCNDGDKEKVLPCGHASCKKCIDKLIAGRSRKCPQCSSRFDQNDVKPLHLQSSFGDHT